MDMQETRVFRPAWGAKLSFTMKNAVMPMAGMATSYLLFVKGIDVGMIILIAFFAMLFLVVALMACTSEVIITPTAVVKKSIFSQRNIPVYTIQRVCIQQEQPHSPIKMIYVLIEANDKKNLVGGLFSVGQRQIVVDTILELIRIGYPQNYESVLHYSSHPELALESRVNTASIVDLRGERVFAPSWTVKIVIMLPSVLIALVLFVDIHSVLVLIVSLGISLPFMGIWFRKITISSDAVISRTLWRRRTIPLGAIRVAKITSGYRKTANLVIQTDRSKFTMGSGLTGYELNDALTYVLELIRVNHPENYEMVRQADRR